MARYLFPGGNTALGFFSFYDHILPEEETRRMIISKGGPGVGKSTFMRRIGAALAERRACGGVFDLLLRPAFARRRRGAQSRLCDY